MRPCGNLLYTTKACVISFLGSSGVARLLIDLVKLSLLSGRTAPVFIAAAVATHSLKFRTVILARTQNLGATWAQNLAVWAQIKGRAVSKARRISMNFADFWSGRWESN